MEGRGGGVKSMFSIWFLDNSNKIVKKNYCCFSLGYFYVLNKANFLIHMKKEDFHLRVLEMYNLLKERGVAISPAISFPRAAKDCSKKKLLFKNWLKKEEISKMNLVEQVSYSS